MLKEIHYYKVIIPSKKQQYSFNKKEPSFEYKVKPVLLENESQYVFSRTPTRFAVIAKQEKRNGTYSKILNDENIYFERDGIFTNGIHYTCYSEKKKSHKIIKNKIQRYIEKELEFVGNIDLSFIK